MTYLRLPGVCAVVSISLGCGLRTVPIFEASTDTFADTDTDSDSDTDSSGEEETGPIEPPVEGRLGSCSNPIPLPTTDSTAKGTLRGPGLYGDEACGLDDGLEDVYLYAPAVGGDLSIEFDASGTDFRPVLKILEGACPLDEGVPRMCTDETFEGDEPISRNMLVLGNRQYYIHIDSAEGNGGDYEFSILHGEPPLEDCKVHTEIIFQSPSSVFSWQNDLTAGQGVVASACQSIGRENMFAVSAAYPGNMYVDLVGSNGFRPVISVRSGCGTTTEIDCMSDAAQGTPGFANLVYFIPGPGTYYVVADTLGLAGGSYSLNVAFD